MALEVYCRTLDSKYDVEQASRHIDILTFNRINAIGWDNLTPFQKETIEKVCEKQAIFEYEYKDVLNNPFSSYGVNGVTMSFNTDSSILHLESGIKMPSDLYERLQTTGLCNKYL